MNRPLTVMLVAAEASGDALGAGLARALRARLGEGIHFVGVGGRLMAEEGVSSPFDIAELSVLGAVEGVRAYPRVVRRVRDTLALAGRERPDVAVLIDSWGFTLRVAQGLRRLLPGTGIVKYVGPQVWASRPGRAHTLARTVDLLLAIHAFDAPHFEAAGLRTVFVGNHALSRRFDGGNAARLRQRIGVSETTPVLLLMPGSRPAEVDRLLPHYRRAFELLKRARPDLTAVLPVADTVRERVKALTAEWLTPEQLIEGEAGKLDAFAAARAGIVCSGTATTELALAGRPMVVAYRVSALTFLILKAIIRTPYATLFNIAAGEEVARELLQYDCTGAKLAQATGVLLDDKDRAARQVAAQTAALERMGRGGPDPSERAAEAVLDLVREKRLGRPATYPARV